MKRLTIFLFLFPSVTFSAPFDLLINQKNIADTATFQRVVPLQSPNSYNMLATDTNTNLPMMVTLGQPFGIFNNQLEVSIRWDQVLNAPVLSPVATSGDYNDLSNKPSAFSGDYSSLTGIPASFTPSAHNQAFSTITATPTTLAGYGIADGATLTQLATKFTTPAGTSAQYVRGDGALATLPVGKRIETFTGSTDANGLITVTYSPAYPSVPSVQPGPPPSSDMSWVLVSSTTTGFSIRLVQRSVLTVLSLQVLAGTVTNVASSPAQVLVVGQ